MPPQLPNYYVVLGVTPGATPDEIRQAYRLRARELHPDANPSEADAAQRFRLVAEAYQTLASPDARVAYDMQLHMASAAGPADLARRRLNATTEPALTLRVVPGAAAIGRLSDPTRFYLLGELLPTHPAAQAWSPLDLAVMFDRSSSMRGPKIFEAKRAVKSLISQLSEDDRLTLLAFDDRPQTLLAGDSPVGAVGAIMALDSVAPRGATQLAPALEVALNALQAGVTSGRIGALLLITDGRTYGDEDRCMALAERARLLGTPIFSFGLGLEWNRDLLDHIAAESGGACEFVEEPSRLNELLEAAVRRLRDTLVANIRLSLQPAPATSILRASSVAPELTDVFEGPHLPGEIVTVKLGTMTAQPQTESVVALWELLLDPLTLAEDPSGGCELGTISADWSLARDNSAYSERVSQRVVIPQMEGVGVAPPTPELRLALELLTAARLHAQADRLATSGATAEAAAALSTSALRLTAAGDIGLARESREAASALLTAPGEGMTAMLRAKYTVKNLSAFHALRRAQRGRLAAPEHGAG